MVPISWEAVRLAFFVGTATVLLTVAKLYYSYILRPRWHMRYLPQPKRGTFMYGQMRRIAADGPGEFVRKLFDEMGPVAVYDSHMGMTRFTTLDKTALHHILIADSYSFPKPGILRRLLGSITGHGILITEGSTHQRQRKIMSPSFGAPHMKSMYPLFIDKALRLRDEILQVITDTTSTSVSLDIYDYANRATLDVIGSAGFGYEPDAIHLGHKSELFNAFNQLFGSFTGRISFLENIKRFFPVLNFIPDNSTRAIAVAHSASVMDNLGQDLIREKKIAITGDAKESSKSTADSSQMAGRDLLTTLIRANMAADLRPQQKMTDAEILAQIHTFLVAGNDTTANGLCWAVYGLCKHPETQKRLRDELLSVPTEAPSFDELNSLPYLDAVVRETLRVYSPVAGTTRVASKDNVIPLSKPFIDAKGVAHNTIFIAKNTQVYIPILPTNKRVDVWGPDAAEFNPSRWIEGKLPEGVMEWPSVAMPTFLAGPRGCIGFRFSLIEMKTMLFSLIRVLSLELAVPMEEIEGKSNVVTRPRLKSKPDEGWQLPLILTLVDTTA